MAHNVHNETVVPGSFAKRQARALFSTLVLTLWVLGFTYFIYYKYLYARCMHTLPIGFTFEFLERYNVSLTGLI